MARGLIIITLLATSLFPCLAQESQGKSIPELLVELKKPHKEADKAKLLLDLALAYVYKPGEAANDLDSALLLVKQAEEINADLHNKKIEAKSYFVYSNALREKGNAKLGQEYIEKSLTLYKTISEPEDMAEAWRESGSYYSAFDEGISKKKDCYEKALALFRTSGNKNRQAVLLEDLGDFNQIMGNNMQAMKELREALSIYLSVGHKKLQGVYSLLGQVSSNMGDYPGAVKYGLLAVRVAEDMKDSTSQLCTIYCRLGTAYYYLTKYEESVIYSKKALNIAEKNNDVGAIGTVALQLIYSFDVLQNWKESLRYARLIDSALKKPCETIDSMFLDLCYGYSYLVGKQYARAGAYTNELVVFVEKHPDFAKNFVTVYNYLFDYFMAMQHYTEAKKYASMFLSVSQSLNLKSYIVKGYLIKSKADSALGNFQAALASYQSYRKLTYSIWNETTSFQFAEQQVEYETEKKDNDIKLLKQHEQIQKAQLLQTRLTNNIVIASVVVLALLLGLLYNRYRTKQRHNKELELKQREINEKNSVLENLINEKDELIADKDVLLTDKDVLLTEKEWLVKEIHHRVKNNLQMVISLLNAQSEFLNNPSALEAIRESRERMQAIAILHQKLYRADTSTRINMRSYVNELMDNIRSSVVDTRRIEFLVDVAPDIELDISQSVPLGLILNEGITNSIKYAYGKNEKGSIRISLQYIGDQQLQLKIADHGKGLPEGLDAEHSNSLGLQLIKLFAEQLEGDLFFINNNGLEIILNFRTAEFSDVFNGKEKSVTA